MSAPVPASPRTYNADALRVLLRGFGDAERKSVTLLSLSLSLSLFPLHLDPRRLLTLSNAQIRRRLGQRHCDVSRPADVIARQRRSSLARRRTFGFSGNILFFLCFHFRHRLMSSACQNLSDIAAFAKVFLRNFESMVRNEAKVIVLFLTGTHHLRTI
jgi:hypothetical protein